ncbi:uncharacterized protein SOCE836_014190 [Sorangium cellulosum]|uniref:Uncharacterized protein n=1 Tax=Sorangium cellulosum TaxID=56 RepID=A0A4P2QID0_SORCE|nr:uncharacterized protein SOCE836_014190 [Sorangium cellulosum]
MADRYKNYFPIGAAVDSQSYMTHASLLKTHFDGGWRVPHGQPRRWTAEPLVRDHRRELYRGGLQVRARRRSGRQAVLQRLLQLPPRQAAGHLQDAQRVARAGRAGPRRRAAGSPQHRALDGDHEPGLLPARGQHGRGHRAAFVARPGGAGHRARHLAVHPRRDVQPEHVLHDRDLHRRAEGQASRALRGVLRAVPEVPVRHHGRHLLGHRGRQHLAVRVQLGAQGLPPALRRRPRPEAGLRRRGGFLSRREGAGQLSPREALRGRPTHRRSRPARELVPSPRTAVASGAGALCAADLLGCAHAEHRRARRGRGRSGTSPRLPGRRHDRAGRRSSARAPVALLPPVRAGLADRGYPRARDDDLLQQRATPGSPARRARGRAGRPVRDGPAGRRAGPPALPARAAGARGAAWRRASAGRRCGARHGRGDRGLRARLPGRPRRRGARPGAARVPERRTRGLALRPAPPRRPRARRHGRRRAQRGARAAPGRPQPGGVSQGGGRPPARGHPRGHRGQPGVPRPGPLPPRPLRPARARGPVGLSLRGTPRLAQLHLRRRRRGHHPGVPGRQPRRGALGAPEGPARARGRGGPRPRVPGLPHPRAAPARRDRRHGAARPRDRGLPSGRAGRLRGPASGRDDPGPARRAAAPAGGLCPQLPGRRRRRAPRPHRARRRGAPALRLGGQRLTEAVALLPDPRPHPPHRVRQPRRRSHPHRVPRPAGRLRRQPARAAPPGGPRRPRPRSALAL